MDAKYYHIYLTGERSHTVKNDFTAHDLRSRL